jgi:hypothetical protein
MNTIYLTCEDLMLLLMLYRKLQIGIVKYSQIRVIHCHLSNRSSEVLQQDVSSSGIGSSEAVHVTYLKVPPF